MLRRRTVVLLLTATLVGLDEGEGDRDLALPGGELAAPPRHLELEPTGRLTM
ncbi:MAG: hypothetical protein ACRD2T_11745 [Thermoanaerobaculia bacterium]